MSDGDATAWRIDAGAGLPRTGRRRAEWRRFLANRRAVIGAALLVALAVASLLASVVAPHDPDRQRLARALERPSLEHPMGTDNFGRDVFSRTLSGGRISQLIGLLSMGVSVVVGVVLGGAAGYLGGRIDTVLKSICFRGKASHAGARPDLGINALNAAALAIMGINAQRETFRDEDAVRVHHILTAGGHSVNIVPEDVRMELFARGRSLEAIRDAAAKVTRAVAGAAQMVGAEVEIQDLPGYLPLVPEQVMATLFRENAIGLLGGDQVLPGGHVAASTDMGDLSHLMPALHPFAGGYRGTNHSRDFRVADEEMAYVLPAKMMALTVVDLLYGDAAAARRAVESYTPRMTKADYLAYLRGEAPRQRPRPASASPCPSAGCCSA